MNSYFLNFWRRLGSDGTSNFTAHPLLLFPCSVRKTVALLSGVSERSWLFSFPALYLVPFFPVSPLYLSCSISIPLPAISSHCEVVLKSTCLVTSETSQGWGWTALHPNAVGKILPSFSFSSQQDLLPFEEVPAVYFLRFAKCFVASLWFLPQIWWQHIVCIYWWFVSTCCILGFVEIPCFIFLGNVHLHFWFCYLLAFSVFVWRFGKIKKQGTNTSPSIFTYVIIIWLLLHLLLWLTLKCKKINIFQLIKMEFWRQTLSKVLVCRELIWK